MELNECINFLLTASQHRMFKELSGRLAECDITPVQYGVLYCLWKLDKTNPNEIAKELRLENSTISGVLERLEKKGLIVRRLNENDRRFIVIESTKEGKSLEEPVIRIVDQFNYDVLADMMPEEQKLFKDTLRKIGDYE